MAKQVTGTVADENWDLIIQSLDRLSEGITIIDSNDKLVLYNNQAAEYLGIDKSRIGVAFHCRN